MPVKKEVDISTSKDDLQKSNDTVLELRNVLGDDGSIHDVSESKTPKSQNSVFTEIERLVGGINMTGKKGKSPTKTSAKSSVTTKSAMASRKSSQDSMEEDNMPLDSSNNSNTSTKKESTSTPQDVISPNCDQLDEESNLDSEAIISNEKALEIKKMMSIIDMGTTKSTVGDPTLKELVGDMIRPMLKDWMDQNLTNIVRDTVKQAIDEVIKKD